MFIFSLLPSADMGGLPVAPERLAVFFFTVFLVLAISVIPLVC